MSKTVHDYDNEDGWEDGLEICPHCRADYLKDVSPIYNQQGQRFDYLTDTDPKKGPYFCKKCYEELETNHRQEKNKPLGDFHE